MSRSRGERRPRGDRAPEQVLYAPEAAAGSRVRIEGPEADHGLRSLRLRTGAEVYLVDGRGTRFQGEVVSVAKRALEVEVLRAQPIAVWPTRRVALAAGVLKSTRMDIVVEKASELGVDAFHPLNLKHCVARPHERGVKRDRWERLAVESLKQCRRARLMTVHPPTDLPHFLASLPVPGGLWFAEPSGGAIAGAAQHLTDASCLTLVVGPEGGLAPEEVEGLTGAGGIPVTLGGHRLRAETAAVTLVTAALAILGELDHGVSAPVA